MRIKTNMRGLVSHTTPQSSRLSEEEILQKKFNSGNITKDEQYKLASFMVIRKSNHNKTYTEVFIWGNWHSINKYGFDVNILLKEDFKLR